MNMHYPFIPNPIPYPQNNIEEEIIKLKQEIYKLKEKVSFVINEKENIEKYIQRIRTFN